MNSDILQNITNEDYVFINRIQSEVTQSCALPFSLPVERIPALIYQAAQYFWLNSDWCSENRYFAIRNSDIHKHDALNKHITLPEQIIGIGGVYKINNSKSYGALGDFSIERMVMSTYSQFGGKMTSTGIQSQSYNLTDAITAMYEVSTYNQYLNAPITYDYNIFSHQLLLLGDLGYSDLLIDCFVRTRIQSLYNNYYFFRYVVCLTKKALSDIYGYIEFNLPGGVKINYDRLESSASDEISEIQEWIKQNNGNSLILQPNTL